MPTVAMVLDANAQSYFPNSSQEALVPYSPPPPPPPPTSFYFSPPLQPYDIYLNMYQPQTTICYSPPPFPQDLSFYISPHRTIDHFIHNQYFSLNDNFPSLPPPPPLLLSPRREMTLTPLEEEDGVIQSQNANMQVEEVRELEIEERSGETMRLELAHEQSNVGLCSRKCKGKASNRFSRGKTKYGSQRSHLCSLSPDEYQFKEKDDAEGEGCLKTTVMIKNIPNKYTKKRLLEILDAHCMKENQKLLAEKDDNPPILSEFDFLYLPFDFSTGCNKGYAFVNFTTPKAAWKLYRDLNMTSWNELGSRKICEITYARVQGLAALRYRFKNSTFRCESDDYLPVYFSPSRNGLAQSQQYYAAERFQKKRAC